MIVFKRFAYFLILTVLLLPVIGLPQAASAQSENDPNTPIEHLIVVMQQNHTFDNYFGTYPGVNGIPEGVCVPVTLSDPNNKECLAPYEITTQPISDLSHSD